jgi:hypothetical protein
MPQIWMTYDEIAGLVGCCVEEARAQVIARALDRKKSGDGHTRVKLDMLWTALFVAKLRESDDGLDRAIDDLRLIHSAMTRRPARPEQIPDKIVRASQTDPR